MNLGGNSKSSGFFVKKRMSVGESQTIQANELNAIPRKKVEHVRIKKFEKVEEIDDFRDNCELYKNREVQESLKDLRNFKGFDKKIKNFFSLMDVCQNLVGLGIGIDELNLQNEKIKLKNEKSSVRMDRQIAMWRRTTEPEELSTHSLKADLSVQKASEPRASHRKVEQEASEIHDEELGNTLKEKFQSLWSGLGDDD